MSEKWVQLTRKIIELDRQGSLEWEHYISHSTEGVQTKIGKFTVEISENESVSQFQFQVRDTFGKVVDEYSDDDLTALGFSGAYTHVKELFRRIHRRLSGADAVIDELLKELDQKDEIPF